jgi:hypothetical protein
MNNVVTRPTHHDPEAVAERSTRNFIRRLTSRPPLPQTPRRRASRTGPILFGIIAGAVLSSLLYFRGHPSQTVVANVSDAPHMAVYGWDGYHRVSLIQGTAHSTWQTARKVA